MKKTEHINLLELRAARETTLKFAKPYNKVRLHVDSKVACAYINKQGGTKSSQLSHESCKLWEEMIKLKVSILTSHWISTTDNCGADFLTRHRINTLEFKLHPTLFSIILTHFNLQPTLDAFASAETRQLPCIMSWNAKQGTVGRDALLCNWDTVTYCFPPVRLIPKVMNKVKKEKLEDILVCQTWPSSLWFLQVQAMAMFGKSLLLFALSAMSTPPLALYQ